MSATNGKPNREDLWGKLTLEQIEHNIGVGTPVSRVYFALLRCQECHPHHYPSAIRPRMRRGGFAEWVRLLHERIAKRRPVVADEIYDEIPDTNDDGEILPLRQRDIEEITGLWQSQVSEAVELGRKQGLIAAGEPLTLVAKPTVAPPFPPGEVHHCTVMENQPLLLKIKDLARSLKNQLGVSITVQDDAPPEVQERTVQLLTEVSTAYKEGLSRLRTECKNRLKEPCTVNLSLYRDLETLDLRPSSSKAAEPSIV